MLRFGLFFAVIKNQLLITAGWNVDSGQEKNPDPTLVSAGRTKFSPIPPSIMYIVLLDNVRLYFMPVFEYPT